jgi:hypothetical protein
VLAVSSDWVSSSVIAHDHQAASLPADCGRGRHVIGNGIVAHPVSPGIAQSGLRFPLDGS